MKFAGAFKEPCFFEPEGCYVSRRAYSREEAAARMQKAYAECGWPPDEMPISPDALQESWVRFGPTGFMEGDLGKMAWMVCPEGTRGAQPVWVFLP